MLSAVYAGIFANDHADQLSVSPECGTGNCTWNSPYVTLGVCSKCYDITSSIQQRCVPITDSNVTQYDDIDCTYSLPHGLKIHGYETGGGTQLEIRGSPSDNTTEGTIHFSGLQNPLAIMYLLNITTPHTGPEPVFNSSFAAECALQYCVKKYNGSVSLGKLNETLIDTFLMSLLNSTALSNSTRVDTLGPTHTCLYNLLRRDWLT